MAFETIVGFMIMCQASEYIDIFLLLSHHRSLEAFCSLRVFAIWNKSLVVLVFIVPFFLTSVALRMVIIFYGLRQLVDTQQELGYRHAWS